MIYGEPSYASKIVKIARQQTLGLLLSNCSCPTVTVLFLNCYWLTCPHIFNHISSYRTPIQEKLVSLES